MLTAETLKPYLLHEDRFVRIAVAHHFYESWSRDVELTPMILASCEQFGFASNVSVLSCCHRFPLTEAAFERALQFLKDTDNDNTAMHLGIMVSKAPIELLAKHETAIPTSDRLSVDLRSRIQHRTTCSSWSGERLWDELQALSKQSVESQDADDIDHSYADALIEALAQYDLPDVNTICRLLKDPETEGEWLEIFLIDLVGQRRLTATIPTLVDKFRVDTDYMLERCSDAIAKMGDPAAVRLIRDAFPQESWDFKNFTASLLGYIQHPESEEAIIALLENEDNLEIRTDLCFGLCGLFSERGVEIVRRQIHAGYAEWMVTLEEELLPVAHVLGIDLPEAEQWMRERDDRERVQAARRVELDELGGRWNKAQRGWNPAATDANFANTEAESLVPVRRHEPRIGRNEPCPCGSGKKHKRCCGRE